MIIFDLDGTLADCEHRRHFIDPSKRDDCYYHYPATLTQSKGFYYKDIFLMCEPPIAKMFIPDWPEFYEACDKDNLIIPVDDIYGRLWRENDYYDDFQIWSGRCESIRKKTEEWLEKYRIRFSLLKMRPIGDHTPDDQLKERWLDEYIASMWPKLDKNAPDGTEYHRKDPIHFVFDSDPKSISMWKRRGIFVFDCNHNPEREF